MTILIERWVAGVAPCNLQITLERSMTNTENRITPSNDNPENQDRRSFLKFVSLGLGAVAAGGSLAATALAQEKKTPAKAPGANAALELVKEDDPLPKGLGYVHDATKTTRADKAGTKGADQLCSNCQFYVKSGEINKAEVGKCTLFPRGVVKANGWCKSWIKKSA
jgi:hypothetical protein